MVDAAVAEKPKPDVKKPDMNIDRVSLPKAKETELSMSQDGHKYARVQFTLNPIFKIEDALRPEFWSQVAHRFQRLIATEGDYAGSVIEVRYPDNSMYAELFVRVVQKSGLVVGLIGEPTYFGPREVKSDAFDVRWNVGKRSHEIVRKSDREVVGEAKTKEDAIDWIKKTVG